MRFYVFLVVILGFSLFTSAQDISWYYQSEINTHNKVVQQVHYSPYRQWMAVAFGETITILDPLGNEIYTGKRAISYGDLCFSPDEQYLLIRNWRAAGDLAFLDLNTFTIKNVVHKEGFMNSSEMYFVKDFHHIVFSSKNVITLFEIDDQAQMKQLQEFHKDPEFEINAVTVSDNGKKLVVLSRGTVKLNQDYKHEGFDLFIYELVNDKYILKEEWDNDIALNFLNFIPGTEKLVFSAENTFGKQRIKYLALYDLSNNKFKQIDRFDLEKEADYAGFSKDGKWMVTSGSGIIFYNISNDKFEMNEEKLWYYTRPYILEFSPDGNHLVTYQKDRDFVQWNLTGFGGDIRSKLYNTIGIDFSPAFKTVLSGCQNCFDDLDPSWLEPKGEFEKSEEFEKRRAKAKFKVLAVLQDLLEKQNSKSSNKLKPGYLLGYNADREVFKAKILGEEVAVRVPLDKAPDFQKRYETFEIGFSKRKTESQFIYEDFFIKDPKTGKKYLIYFKRNPFDFQALSNRSQPTLKYESKIGPQINFGAQHQDTTATTYALVITTNDYKEFDDLVNPILDGETIGKELGDRYAVKTEILQNPSLVDLKMKLRTFAEMKFNDKDQLLIFVAGHGHFDPIFKEGYLVSADSRRNDPSQVSYLSHSSLKTIVKNIPCKHILLVMDVCFGGTFDQDVATGHRGGGLYESVNKQEFINRKLQYKTRLFITSGGKTYVPDGRPGQHSPFARNFLEALRSQGGEDGVLTFTEIIAYLEKAEIKPHFGEFGDNEPGSDFIFVAE